MGGTGDPGAGRRATRLSWLAAELARAGLAGAGYSGPDPGQQRRRWPTFASRSAARPATPRCRASRRPPRSPPAGSTGARPPSWPGYAARGAAGRAGGKRGPPLPVVEPGVRVRSSVVPIRVAASLSRSGPGRARAVPHRPRPAPDLTAHAGRAAEQSTAKLAPSAPGPPGDARSSAPAFCVTTTSAPILPWSAAIPGPGDPVLCHIVQSRKVPHYARLMGPIRRRTWLLQKAHVADTGGARG